MNGMCWLLSHTFMTNLCWHALSHTLITCVLSCAGMSNSILITRTPVGDLGTAGRGWVSSRKITGVIMQSQVQVCCQLIACWCLLCCALSRKQVISMPVHLQALEYVDCTDRVHHCCITLAAVQREAQCPELLEQHHVCGL